MSSYSEICPWSSLDFFSPSESWFVLSFIDVVVLLSWSFLSLSELPLPNAIGENSGTAVNTSTSTSRTAFTAMLLFSLLFMSLLLMLSDISSLK